MPSSPPCPFTSSSSGRSLQSNDGPGVDSGVHYRETTTQHQRLLGCKVPRLGQIFFRFWQRPEPHEPLSFEIHFAWDGYLYTLRHGTRDKLAIAKRQNITWKQFQCRPNQKVANLDDWQSLINDQGLAMTPRACKLLDDVFFASVSPMCRLLEADIKSLRRRAAAATKRQEALPGMQEQRDIAMVDARLAKMGLR